MCLQEFILPNPNRTDVRNPDNYYYTNDLVPNQVPAHIPENVAAGGDTDEDHIPEQTAPATDPHNTHTLHLKMLHVHLPTRDQEEMCNQPLLMRSMLNCCGIDN